MKLQHRNSEDDDFGTPHRDRDRARDASQKGKSQSQAQPRSYQELYHCLNHEPTPLILEHSSSTSHYQLNSALEFFYWYNPDPLSNSPLRSNLTGTTTTSPSISKRRYMERNLRQLKLNLDPSPDSSPPPEIDGDEDSTLEWDWDVEHADRKAEAKADAALHGALPFEVDRKVLRDVVREKMGAEVVRIKFLSAGTFHKEDLGREHCFNVEFACTSTTGLDIPRFTAIEQHMTGTATQLAQPESSLKSRVLTAYLVTLVDRQQVVARVARRFMPRLKTESEVATMQYIREHTTIPVPTIYHYDSNPYNRLGGEFILMSKARGIPLSKVYHSLSYNDLVKLLTNLAELVLPLFAHRFSELGSLYFGPNPRASTPGVSAAPTPKAIQMHYSAFPFSPTLAMSPIPTRQNSHSAVPKVCSSSVTRPSNQEYHVGPIISWAFFGSNRGDLVHPDEINRGPWSSSQTYFASCVQREVTGVIRENEGKAAPHKLHLDPDEILSSRHHHVKAVPGDESDDSDEWDLEESEDEWEGPGDVMYRDYRRMQRTTFLIAHINEREKCVRREMERWMKLMEKLIGHEKEMRGGDSVSHQEEFGLDCHDLSLENVFVDEVDHHKITCIIDWESTTTRPLWACAHLPAFLQYSPFTAKIFRDILANMASSSTLTSTPELASSLPTAQLGADIGVGPRSVRPRAPQPQDIPKLAREWLTYERTGMRLRMAHRFVEWDGWEEGLADSTLGEEEHEDSWFAETECVDWSTMTSPPITASANGTGPGSATAIHARNGVGSFGTGTGSGDGGSFGAISAGVEPNAAGGNGSIIGTSLTRRKTSFGKSKKLPFAAELESTKEQMLETTGDICGGRGGELGRRLEAWLSVNGHDSTVSTHEPVVGPRRRWHNDVDEHEHEGLAIT